MVSQLLALRGTENEALRGQVVEMEIHIHDVESNIAEKEELIEKVVAGAYGVDVVDV